MRVVFLTYYLNVLPVHVSFGYSLLEGCVKTDAIDDAESCCAQLEDNPTVFLYIVELLGEQIDIESALRMTH